MSRIAVMRRSAGALRRALALVLVASAVSVVMVDFAEARRIGGFGSRGARTFTRPAPTRTAPNEARPIDRSMTPRQQQAQPGTAARSTQAATRQSRGLFGGLAGGLLGGLMLGGLIGMLMGTGLGGMAGLFGLILQIGLVVLAVVVIRRLFFGQNRPAFAGGPADGADGPRAAPFTFPPRAEPPVDAAPAVGGAAVSAAGQDEIGITQDDLDAFEQILVEMQAAFAREDYARLRTLCTPEIVSYLSEELSQNAVNGRRNEVFDVRLLQGDVAEAWREGDEEYATVALRYESVDIMRDRATGEVVDGDPTPTESSELWTFVRPVGSEWKLSAINET